MDHIEQIDSIKCEIEGTITAIKPDNYGRRLSIGTSTGKIYIYKKINNSFQKVYELEAHIGPILKIDWAHQNYGNIFVTCGFDKKVNLFQEIVNENFSLLYEFNEHNNCVTCVSFYNNANNFLFISGCLDGNIAVHKYQSENQDFITHKIFAHNFGVNSISFFHNNDIISFVTCGNDNLIKVWKFNNEKGEYENIFIEDKLDSINRFVCCKDEYNFFSCGDDGVVYYFVKNKEKNNWDYKEIFSNSTPIVGLSLNENGNAIDVIGIDGVDKVITEDEFLN